MEEDKKASEGGESLPYSYHTFLYPFLWDDGGRVTLAQFRNALGIEKNEDEEAIRWVPDYLVDGDNRLLYQLPQNLNNGQIGRYREDYRTFQYFNAATRRALFQRTGSNESEIVSCYRLENLRECRYVIDLKGKEIGKRPMPDTIKLRVNAIRLKIFHTGVAIMVFELEYCPKIKADGNPGSDEISIDDARRNVLLINEYGRRVYAEYLTDVSKDLLCANSISLNTVGCVDYFAYYYRTEGEAYCGNPVRMPNLVTQTLNCFGNGDIVFTADRQEQEKGKRSFYLEPAIDSRMFVCCCVRDDEYANGFLGYNPWSNDEKAVKERRQKHEWDFMTNWDVGQELYAFLNCDPDPTFSSCQNRVELDRYFSEQLYPRWLESGTIHGVTNHSLMCITSSSQKVVASVVNPFLTLYTQMCILTLAQRASLISFDAKITATAQTRLKKSRDKARLLELKEEFTLFESQLLLEEVTPQIQGIEIYQKLQKMLFVRELKDNIQNQMENLFAIVSAKQGDNLNRGGLILAICALALEIGLSSLTDVTWKAIGYAAGCVFAVLLVSCLIAVIGRKPRRKRK